MTENVHNIQRGRLTPNLCKIGLSSDNEDLEY